MSVSAPPEMRRAASPGGPHSQSSEQQHPYTKSPPLAQASNADGFDWDSDDSIILREQRATAAYYNKRGDLIIRQRARECDDEDIFLFITPESENAFLDGLVKRVREG